MLHGGKKRETKRESYERKKYFKKKINPGLCFAGEE
jgi:hypothetical protein